MAKENEFKSISLSDIIINLKLIFLSKKLNEELKLKIYIF